MDNNKIEKVLSTDVCKVEKQFYELVTKAYLPMLSSYQPISHIKDSNDSAIASRDNWKKFRWIKVDQIIYNKDEIFTDKFSMLFVALHGIAKQVAVYISRDKDAIVRYYIGVRDIADNTGDRAKVTLIDGLQGYFPGIKVSEESPTGIDKEATCVSSVSGVASLKGDKEHGFIQGVEKLLDSVKGELSVLIIADRVDEKDLLANKLAYQNLYSDISPLAERQLSYHSDLSESVSQTLTNSFSLSTSKTLGKTITKGVNTSQSSQFNENTSENNGIGFILNIGSSNSSGVSTGGQYGHHRDISDVLSDTIQKSEASSKAEGKQDTTTTGNSIQITLNNRKVQGLLDLLDEHIERLDKSAAIGMWSCATYFLGKDETRTKAQANIYRGSIVGEGSEIENCVVNFWKNTEVVDYLKDMSHPQFRYSDSDMSLTPCSMVNSNELAIHLSLPQTSVPGIVVRERAPFGRNVIQEHLYAEDSISIPLGKILHLGQKTDITVNIDVDSLTKHTFITGTTGSGKSNTIYLLIDSLLRQRKKILVIEPTKGEYKNVFGEGIEIVDPEGNKDTIPVNVYGSNPNYEKILRINPFAFPNEVHVYEHIDRLVEIFNACWPMYAAMPVVLKKAITDAYTSCGWDLYNSECNAGEDIKLFPTINDVVVALRNYINNSEYSADTKGDYKGSIETRLLSLSEGLTGQMLNCGGQYLSDKELFDENVIVDLSKVGNTETKSLIMGMLIMKMSEYYQAKSISENIMNSSLKHVTIMEEAHNLLKRTSLQQSQESSNLAGKSVEMITNSIAEMRTYGEGFIIIDQSPAMVDLAAIRNTNTKIIMSLPEEDDRNTAGKSIGLTDNQIEEISRQKVGQAIVYQNNWEQPVQCQVKEFEYHNIRYSSKESLPRLDNFLAVKKILSFLYGYCGGKLNQVIKTEDLWQEVVNCNIISSVKYSLLQIIKHYDEHGADMAKMNHSKVMEIAGYCIGLSEPIKKLLSHKKKNIKEANNDICDMIKRKFPNEDEQFYRFCTRCSLRLIASESSSSVEFYNNWLHTYYKF